tara:strand:- start:15420 stop:15710 length:291 start_codon:yes stop_codon:yes gene_type:complete
MGLAALDGKHFDDSYRQKQVDRAIERAFKRLPPKGKCCAKLSIDGMHLSFHHYQHTLLYYDLARGQPIMTWSELPTDRRILRAALANLQATHGVKK